MGNEKKAGFTIGSFRDLSTPANKGKGETPIHDVADLEVVHIERLDTSNSKNTASLELAKVRFQKHWRRFWCCYLVAVVVFLAIFLPVLYVEHFNQIQDEI